LKIEDGEDLLLKTLHQAGFHIRESFAPFD
jgi:hypothetical protein